MEVACFDRLRLLQRSGEVVGLLRQVRFHLPGNVRDGRDFLVFWADAAVTFDDLKGKETDLYPWATVRALRRERGA